MRPGAPDVVLRPREGDTALTIGPAFVTVTGSEVSTGTWTRGLAAVGAAARLRAHLADDPPGRRLPEILRISIVDGRTNILAVLPWNGTDHEGLEVACATARLPLDRMPDTAPRYVGAAPTVLAPQSGAQRPRRQPPAVLEFGQREVVLVDESGQRSCWPRLGCALAGEDSVARLGVTMLVTPGDTMPRTLTVTLLAEGGRELVALPWPNGDLSRLRLACANSGVMAQYRWASVSERRGPLELGPPPPVRRSAGASAGTRTGAPAPPELEVVRHPARPARPPARRRLDPTVVIYAGLATMIVALAVFVAVLLTR